VSFPIFVVLLSFGGAGLFFWAALSGLRPRLLLLLALGGAAAFWIAFSVVVPGDEDTSKADYVKVFGMVAVWLLLFWAVGVWLGWGIRNHSRRNL
jgi:hypothetical protein